MAHAIRLQQEHIASVELVIQFTPIRSLGLEASLIKEIVHVLRELRVFVFLLEVTNPSNDVLPTNS